MPTEALGDAIDLVRRPGAFPVDLEAKAGLVGLLDFGADPLEEPFFTRTAERVLREAGLTDSGWVTIDALAEATRSAPPPAGVLCHVGRCGSTLLTNMLGRLGFRVIRESGVLAEAFDATGAGDDQAALRPLLDSEQQRAIIGSYCRGAADEVQPTILKLASTDTRLLPALRVLWPKVPIACVRRDLHEVIASNLIGRAGWLVEATDPETVEQSLLARLSTLGLESPERRQNAAVLLTHLQHAIRTTMAATPDDTRLDIDFQTLVDSPEQTLTAVVEHFGRAGLLRPTAVADALLERQTYAKSGSGDVKKDGVDPVTRYQLTAEEAAEVDASLSLLAGRSEPPYFAGLPVYMP